MADVIFYYSRTQNTQKVSKIISQQTGAKVVEIKDQKNRSGKLRFATSLLDSFRNAKTEIKYEDINLTDYDTIYIGSPIWASNITPAIRKFIEENDFTDCNIITFLTFMNEGQKEALNIINKEVKSKGGNIIRSFAIKTKDTDIEKLTLNALCKN